MYHGANCNIDHYLVKAKFRCHVARYGQTGNTAKQPLNIEKLKDGHIAKLYIEALENTLTQTIYSPELSVNDLQLQIKNNIKSVAHMILSHTSYHRRNDFFDKECGKAEEK